MSLRLVYIATDPITAYRLMDGQLAYMRQHGFDVTVITSPGAMLERTAQREGVRAIAIPLGREISPLADAVALARLTAALRALRPHIVNAGTPKAGLLGVTAARLAQVPVVIYLLRGLRFEGAAGLRRLLLAATEHASAALAHRVFVNSASLRERFVALGCAPAEKTWIPGAGSSNGVELERFASTEERRAWAAEMRRKWQLPGDAVVIGFVGRFTRDKGLVELVRAFQRASSEEARLRLLLVGSHDPTDPLPGDVRELLASDARIITTGFVDEPAPYYAAMDVFAFASRREGFPNAVLEAAAAGVAVVAFRATGTVDAVVHDETGTLLEMGDEAGLALALRDYARDHERRKRHGQAGAARAAGEFRRERVWSALEAEYRRLAQGLV